MLISFLNDVDIQLILEIKSSFRKYHPECPKNPLRVFLGKCSIQNLKSFLNIKRG